MDNIDLKKLEQKKKTRYPIAILDSIDGVKTGNNKVIVKIHSPNSKDEKEGLKVVGDTEWDKAGHTDRIGIAIKVPDKLYYERGKMGSMPWQTTMQIKEGDLLLFSYFDSFNADFIIAQGEEYRLIPYQEIYAAKRPFNGSFDWGTDSFKRFFDISKDDHVDEIIPLNGYIICEEFMQEKTSGLDVISDKRVDIRVAKIRYKGRKITEYYNKRYSDKGFSILRKGDIVIKKNPADHRLTEDPMHVKFFDKPHIILQRKDIIGVIKK